MSVVTVVAAVLGIGVALVKWLRVMQREHYLPGSVIAMALVWIRAVPINGLLAATPLLVLVFVAVGAPVELGVVSAIALGVFPMGLSVRGRTSTMAWTPRARRLAGICVGLVVAVGWLGGAVGGDSLGGFVSGSALVVLASVFVLLELALRVAGPIERRLSERFVDEAAATLKRIGPTVVGITGSFGKTSTKGYVRDLVEGTHRVVASPASFNNRMGLSRAVNEHLTGDAEVFVAEMGTYGPGEIADLCSWIPPQIAVMTAIGPVHLERFKTEANIVLAKSEILETASVGVFNVDHPTLDELSNHAPVATVWRCGTSEAATDIRVVPTAVGHEIHVRGELIGVATAEDVFAANLACAVAVALELGVSETDIVERAQRIAPPAHRQTVSVSDAGFSIIDDTFNSNPAGAVRALDALAAHGGPHARRVVVTPGMVELGPRQAGENEGFAKSASAIADDIVIVGRTNRTALQAGTRGGDASVIVVSSRPAAVEWVRTHLGAGDVVLYENDLPDHYP